MTLEELLEYRDLYADLPREVCLRVGWDTAVRECMRRSRRPGFNLEQLLTDAENEETKA